MIGKFIDRPDGRHYYIDHKEVTKAEWKRAFPPVVGKGNACFTQWKKPVESDALCVHPDQIKEAYDDSRKKGVPTEFTKEGQPILTSAAHKRAYIKAYRFYDRNCHY